MTPLGHTGIAILTGLAASRFFPNLDSETILIAITLGGVAPDWDVFYYNIKTKTKFLHKDIGDHRFQLTHTPFFMIAVGIVLSFIPHIWFFILGTLIHLLIDTLFFPEGVILLYPFSKKNYNFFPIEAPSFWTKKPITRVEGWCKNYLTSPFFWIFEVIPTIIAIILLFLI